VAEDMTLATRGFSFAGGVEACAANNKMDQSDNPSRHTSPRALPHG
jgi:hypothetical protein